MIISTKNLEVLFAAFSKFIAAKDGQSFQTFKASSFIDNEENYKYSVYNEARERLGQKWWRLEDVGTGKIQQAVNSAIPMKVNHNFKMVDNNLLDWRKKDKFLKKQKDKPLETLLYNFYKSKINDSEAFQLFLDKELSYQLIAYLFFIKDSQRFMPISQERFDRIFEMIGIPDFKTSRHASWENYSTFNNIIKQVRDFLRIKDHNTTLLDAHSFLWTIGSPMFALHEDQLSNTLAITEKPSVSSIHPEDQNVPIAEEDEALTFPEGIEVFRLHKSKERNKELVRAAKLNRLRTDKKLSCEVCGFSFTEKYGKLGEGFIEAHHLFPISQLTEETETKIDDIALVCSNCHRMLHRRRPWLTLVELKSLLQHPITD
jgi:predicted HNH restriction endonuclease